MNDGGARSCPNSVRCRSQSSLTSHLNRCVDGVFEAVRVVGRCLVSIAEVHAIVARAHLAQGEAEMTRDRFGFLERHRASSAARRQWVRAIGCMPKQAAWLARTRRLCRTLVTAAEHCAKCNPSRACLNIESACLIAGTMR